MILKISIRAKAGIPKTLVKQKLRLNSLYFPQNTLMLTESRGEFSDLRSNFRLLALRYCHLPGFLNLPWSFARVLSFFSIFFLRSHFFPTFSRLFSRPFFSPFCPTFLSTVSESHGTNHVNLGLFYPCSGWGGFYFFQQSVTGVSVLNILKVK